MKKPSDKLVVLGVRFEKAVAAFLRAVDGRDVSVLMDRISDFGLVLQDIEDLPTTGDRMALSKFLHWRGNVPEGITDRVLAEMERLSRDLALPMPSQSKN